MALMNEQNLPAVALAAFILALIGIALGFSTYQRLGEVALGLGKVEMVGAAVTRGELDAHVERMDDLTARIDELEKQLAEERAARAVVEPE